MHACILIHLCMCGRRKQKVCEFGLCMHILLCLDNDRQH